MKTKEIKEMTKNERKARLVLLLKSYNNLMVEYLLITTQNIESIEEIMWLKEAKIALNLIKNIYYMETGEHINTWVVLNS